MENVIGKSSREDEKEGIAVRNMLEMCYAKPTVESAVQKLRNQGNSKYTLMDMMEIITDLLITMFALFAYPVATWSLAKIALQPFASAVSVEN